MNRKFCIPLLSLLLVGVFTLLELAAAPTQISYQGKLTDNLGAPLPSNNYALKFRIFNAVSGGALLWAENQTVTVVGGVYNVNLGQGATTTGTFDHNLFSNDNRWLEVVVGGEVLSPRQRITSVAYALQAEEASVADNAGTFGGHLPADFSFASHSHSLNWSEIASKPSGFADNTDNVGITSESDPTVLSTVKDGISWGEISNRPAGLDDGDDIGGTTGRELIIDAVGIDDWTLSSTGDFQAQTGYFFIKDKTTDTLHFTIDQNSGLASTRDLNIAGTAKINIGGGSFDFTTPGGWPGIIGLAPNGYRREIAIKNDFMWILAGDSASAPDATHGIIIRNNGNVGIGTSSPSDKLHVLGDLKVEGHDGWNSTGDEAIVSLGSITQQFYMKAVWGDGLKLGAYAAGDAFVLKQISGNVGIGTSNPTTKLDVNGETTTKVLRITGGADIAEPFDIKPDDAVRPGMVLTIDPENPGKLRISEKAYDRRVAGIISSAGGIQPGMVLSQTGTLAEGEYPIALTGRVYCWADTNNGSIEPGDLLTTSDTIGHAMKVTDHSRSQGAVLGKAMSSLKEEKGMVLVLVSLQ